MSETSFQPLNMPQKSHSVAPVASTAGPAKAERSLIEISMSTETTSVSDRILLRPMNRDYNLNGKLRNINLVWRKKRGLHGTQSFLTQQKFSHWGLEIVSPDQSDGYVWELRLDPDDNGVLASASDLNGQRVSWGGDGINKRFTGVVTALQDAEIQFRAQIIAACMRRPMLGGSNVEHKYGEFRNNCHKFARSLALSLTEDRDEQKSLDTFFKDQSSFGQQQSDPRPARVEPRTWTTSDAWS